MRKRCAVLISGHGGNLQALINASLAADYPAEVALVISNQPTAYGLERAKAAGIPTLTLNHRDFPTRLAFDHAIQEALLNHHIELLCLAGFMRILTPWFVVQWQGRILNIHPSLLPLFKGAHAIADALAAGVNETGCSVHYVTPAMDEGPVLLQEMVAVRHDDTLESLSARIHEAEHQIYPQALKMLAASIS